MSNTRKWRLAFAVIAVLLILCIQSAVPVRAKTEKAKLDAYSKNITMKYSRHINSLYFYDATFSIDNLVENADSKATYTAVIKNKKIAKVIKSKDRLTPGRRIILAKKVGKTKSVIYEKKKGVKKRKLGTVTIRVKKGKMADVAEDAIYMNDKGPGMIWLKLNLGDKRKTYDYGSVLHKEVFNNREIGTRFKKSDYKAEFTLTKPSENSGPAEIEEYVENGSDIVNLTAAGRLTAKAAGKTNLLAKIRFKDGSVFRQNLVVLITGAALEKENKYNISNIRDIVVGLDTPVTLGDGTEKPMINFDNAATTPAFQDVMDEVNEKLEMYGSIGRGSSQKSNYSTDLYNHTRDKVLDFLGADPEYYTCFYVNNTTDGLNKLASALIKSKDDLVLATRMEHHANDLSWRERCKVIYAEVTKDGHISYKQLKKKLKKHKGKIKYVTVTAASNVTGYVTDVHRVAKLAHKYGAKIIVDGAQIVAHRKFSMMGRTDAENIDFFVFSAHKMYSPYGGGAVVGLQEVLNKTMPEFYGGGTITVVGDTWQHYKEAPERYEAGSPNYPGVVGLGKAMDILNDVGFDDIIKHEKVLNRKLIAGLKKHKNVIIYGNSNNIDDRVGVVSFNFSDINSKLVADKLSELGAVATRRGAFCAHPYVWRLMGIPDSMVESFESCTDAKTPGMIRVSFGIYNTEEEVDEFLKVLPEAMKAAKEEQESEDADVVPEY